MLDCPIMGRGPPPVCRRRPMTLPPMCNGDGTSGGKEPTSGEPAPVGSVSEGEVRGRADVSRGKGGGEIGTPRPFVL